MTAPNRLSVFYCDDHGAQAPASDCRMCDRPLEHLAMVPESELAEARKALVDLVLWFMPDEHNGPLEQAREFLARSTPTPEGTDG